MWVKPSPPSSTAQWTHGVVTRVVSKHNVCVDGVPRHVRDIRKCRRGAGSARHQDTDPEWLPAVDDDESQLPQPELGQENPVESSTEPLPVVEHDDVQPLLDGVEGSPSVAETELSVQRPHRARRRPDYLSDYEC